MHIKSVSLYLPRNEWNIGSRKFHRRKPGHGRGSAPYRRSDWTSRLWAMSKNGQFKTTRLHAALSLDSLEHGLNISWISELSGTPGSYASRFRNCAHQRAPVRWTLTSEPTIWRSPRPCQSRNITEQRIQRLQSRAEESFPSDVTRQRNEAAEFSPKKHELTTWYPQQRTEPTRWTHGKRNQSIQPASTTKVSIISISDWTGKYDLNAVTKHTYLFVIFAGWLSYETGNNVIISTLTSKLPYVCVCLCFY